MYDPYGVSAMAELNSAINNLTSAVGASNTQKKQHENNKEMLSLEQQFQLMLWDKAMQYQTPSNEILRLQQAGVNPALAFSNAGAAAAPVPNVPHGNSSSVVQPPHLDNPSLAGASAAAAAAQIQNQTELTASQVELNTANAAKARADAGLIGNQSDLTAVQADIARVTKPLIMGNAVLDNALKGFEFALFGNKVTRDTIYTGYYPGFVSADLDLKERQIDIARKKYDWYSTTIDYIEKKGYIIPQQARLLHLQGDALLGKAVISEIEGFLLKDAKDKNLPLYKDFVESVKQKYANLLQDAYREAKSIANETAFEDQHGLDSRNVVRWDLPSRQATGQTIVNWSNGLGMVSEAVQFVATRGASAATKQKLDKLEKVNDIIRKYESSRDKRFQTGPFFDNDYPGGTEYTPFD